MASTATNVTYFKGYRMEVDLVAGPMPAAPPLPEGCVWVPWADALLETHARVKCLSFCEELDGIVFPNLANYDGCLMLMREIRNRRGFCPNATWLVARGADYIATVQGVSDRLGAGHIQNLGVIPEERGQGLGTALLVQALHGFRRTGLARAALEVTVQNDPAIRLYRRFGFRFRKTIYRMVESDCGVVI